MASYRGIIAYRIGNLSKDLRRLEHPIATTVQVRAANAGFINSDLEFSVSSELLGNYFEN